MPDHNLLEERVQIEDKEGRILVGGIYPNPEVGYLLILEVGSVEVAKLEYFIDESDELVVHDLFVYPEFRRRGIGTSLLRHVTMLAERDGLIAVRGYLAATHDPPLTSLLQWLKSEGFQSNGAWVWQQLLWSEEGET